MVKWPTFWKVTGRKQRGTNFFGTWCMCYIVI